MHATESYTEMTASAPVFEAAFILPGRDPSAKNKISAILSDRDKGVNMAIVIDGLIMD